MFAVHLELIEANFISVLAQNTRMTGKKAIKERLSHNSKLNHKHTQTDFPSVPPPLHKLSMSKY